MTSTSSHLPLLVAPPVHHSAAAAGNRQAADRALRELRAALDGTSDSERILMEAAAGAGKSYALRAMVAGILNHSRCSRIAVVAFTNRQIIPLARGLGNSLGAARVCLRISKARADLIDDETRAACTVAHKWNEVPPFTQVLISTAHTYKSGISHAQGRFPENRHHPDHAFDVVFVDEAWQLAAYLYRNVAKLAPVVVGVGDVGQLPPFDRSSNPYRGDPGYNPTRAWPTVHADTPGTWSTKIPAVWRPCAEQLPLWRRFYSAWDELHSVAAPGDRSMTHQVIEPTAKQVWDAASTGTPLLLEVDGLPDPEAVDVDLPLLGQVEQWLDTLLAGQPEFHTTVYDDDGDPDHTLTRTLDDPGQDPLIAILATRNSAVEEAEDIVERLNQAHGLAQGILVASTVDSYQGQTNALTIAMHPLSGASELDDFNSAFGRLAVACTRATHALILLTRPGLDTLLDEAPARPGTPLGEPGSRELPRQTHRRILSEFCRVQVVSTGRHRHV